MFVNLLSVHVCVCGFNEVEGIVHRIAGACSVIMLNMFSLLCGANGLNKAV